MLIYFTYYYYFMWNLETAATVVDTAWKAFDKIDNEEKKEWFLSLIEQAEENSAIKWCKEQWNQLSEDQKLKLYNRWAVTIWNSLRNQPVVKIPRVYIDWAKNTVKHWVKNAARFKFLEEIPTRFFVEMGIFNKPEWLTDEQLCKDIKSDAKNVNLYLWICEAICAVVPEAQPAVPIIEWLRKCSKWYKEEWAETLIARVNKWKEEEIKENTSKELAWIIWGWKTKKAA